MIIDLQLHSTYSDGYLNPTQLAKFIRQYGVKIAALTDHNTVGGLAEFRRACNKSGIKTISGIELYVKLDHKKFNLLWYNFDEDSPELHKLLRGVQVNRRTRARNALEQLQKNSFNLSVDKIIDKYNHYIPINKLADELLAVPTNRKMIQRELGEPNPREEEVIKFYFQNKKNSQLRESYVNVKRIFALRKKIGGQLVLNHPGKYGFIKKNFVYRLKELGLDGIEMFSAHHSIGTTLYIQQLARELGLITTGGSDFHREEGGRAPVQNAYSYFKVDSCFLSGFNKIIGKST